MSAVEHTVTIPGRYDGPPIFLDDSAFHEVTLTIGTEVVFPNAQDLLDAVITVALVTDPEGTMNTLINAADELPCQCGECVAERIAEDES